MGGDGNPWHGRSRCPPLCPLGGGWWGHRSLCRSGSCVPTTGGRNQWPGSPAACGGTSARRCTSAAVTGPRAAGLTGSTVPFRPSVREPCPHGAAARRALAAWHEAERQPGGDGVSAAALTRRRLPRCLRPATDPRRRVSGTRSARHRVPPRRGAPPARQRTPPRPPPRERRGRGRRLGARRRWGPGSPAHDTPGPDAATAR